MRKTLLVALTLALSLPLVAAELAPEPHLAPLAPLVGKSWIATFPNGKITDTQTFEWLYDGKFIRNTHQVRTLEGKVVYEGETIYAWDPITESIVWWYWNDTGGFITGTLRRNGEAWIAEGRNHAKGQTPAVRSLMTMGDGTWKATQFHEEMGEMKAQFTLEFKPVK